MPADYTIIPDRNWIDLKAWGVITEQEVFDTFRAYIADPGFRPGMHILVDIRKVELKANLNAVQNFIELLSAHRQTRGENYRLALLVSYSFQETIAQLFSRYAKALPFECEVFKDRDTALAWILADAPSSAKLQK